MLDYTTMRKLLRSGQDEDAGRLAQREYDTYACRYREGQMDVEMLSRVVSLLSKELFDSFLNAHNHKMGFVWANGYEGYQSFVKEYTDWHAGKALCEQEGGKWLLYKSGEKIFEADCALRERFFRLMDLFHVPYTLLAVNPDGIHRRTSLPYVYEVGQDLQIRLGDNGILSAEKDPIGKHFEIPFDRDLLASFTVRGYSQEKNPLGYTLNRLEAEGWVRGYMAERKRLLRIENVDQTDILLIHFTVESDDWEASQEWFGEWDRITGERESETQNYYVKMLVEMIQSVEKA